jgi:hypothetical protein
MSDDTLSSSASISRPKRRPEMRTDNVIKKGKILCRICRYATFAYFGIIIFPTTLTAYLTNDPYIIVAIFIFSLILAYGTILYATKVAVQPSTYDKIERPVDRHVHYDNIV